METKTKAWIFGACLLSLFFLYMLYCPLVSLQKHVENTQATTVAIPRRSNTLRILEDVSYEMTTRV